jgi:PAS domain S-box-containing protein
MLVEDNRDLADDLAEIFREQGHQVQLASDAASARALARASGFDVALVDVRLPDGSGTVLLPDLKAASVDGEVIVTTGNADLESAIAAVANGAFAYLVKPLTIPELSMTVRHALDRVELRRRAADLQQQLSESERRYRDIVESAHVLIVVVDQRGIIRLANRAVETATGYPRDGLLGQRFSALLCPPADAGEMEERMRRAFEAPDEEQETEARGAGGKALKLRLQWTKRTEGLEDVLYGVGLDITRTRELERTARTAEKLAAVGTLTAGLAHEIRNPLNAALLQLTLVERRVARVPDTNGPLVGEPLSRIRGELTRLTDLLTDFLAFARPKVFANEQVDLCELTWDVTTLQQAVASNMGRTLVLEAPQPRVLKVTGDRSALKGVLVNLCRNALEAARTRVVVKLHQEGQQAVLSVEDDGPGLPPQVAARIFEPFFTTKEGGTGLGLAHVFAVVGAHGGEVSLENRPDGGAMARLALPLSRR